MNTIEINKIEEEKRELSKLVLELGLTSQLVQKLKELGYELKEISSSWKYGNFSGEILDFEVKSKKYLNGHYIGVGCGCKMLGKASNGFNFGVYTGFVKQVILKTNLG